MDKQEAETSGAGSLPKVDETQSPIRRSRRDHWLTGALALGALGWVVWGLASNPRLEWVVVWDHLFDQRILQGIWVTIQMTIISMVIAVILGFLVAMLMRSTNPVLAAIARGYVGFFRGLPLLVLLLFTYNIALFAPEIKLGFPPIFGFAIDSNEFITGFTAAIIGLSLHESAFMAEVIRGGLLAVPRGQTEAAIGLGMRRRQAMITIIMPQAIRVIVPATGNIFILLLKATSLVAVIGGGDLLTMAQRIYGANFQVIPLLLVVCFWYLVLVFVASAVQRLLEDRMERGVAGRVKSRTLKGESL